MSLHRGFVAALALLLTTALLLVSLQATAPAKGKRGIKVTPSTVEVGEKITIKGTGWKPGQEVILAVGVQGRRFGEPFATVKPNRQGKFKKKQKIVAAGKFMIVACRAPDCDGQEEGQLHRRQVAASTQAYYRWLGHHREEESESTDLDPMDQFSARTRDWFERSFAGPTPAQEAGWPTIATGANTLICAPTGSGKTLAAFLWGSTRSPARPEQLGTGVKIVYVSPLKALSYDVERNLRAPLAGIGAEVAVGLRTGDTPQKDRQAMLRKPPDILITTPESLYLMMTSRAREILTGVEAVIVDEIHAVAPTQARRPHGADARAARAPRRGRSRTRASRPRRAAAAHRPLGDAAPARADRQVPRRPATDCEIVDAGVRKEIDLEIVVPVEDMADPGARRRSARPPATASRSSRAPTAIDPQLPASPTTARSGRRSTRAARARQRAHLDDHLRQQPPRRRAPGQAAERDQRRELLRRAREGRRADPMRCRRRRGEAAARSTATRDRPRPPRLARARGADQGRGAAQVGTAPLPRRHLLARARHRHGRRRPRDPGRVAEVGRPRHPADRPRRARARRRLEAAGSSRSSAPTCSSARSSPSGCAPARSRRR